MKNTILHAALFGIITPILCSQAYATPVSASMGVTAYAKTNAGATDSQTSTDAWGTPLSALHVDANANAVDTSGTSVQTHGTGNATFGAGGNSGDVNFRNYGWDFNGTGGVAMADQSTDWTYTFVADGNGIFTMDYNVQGHGSTFGLWGWNINWNGVGLLTLNANDPTTSGSISESLIQGQTYTVSLHNNANISGNGSHASMDGDFLWNMNTQNVPEPAPLALLGLGLVGLIARRNRKV